MKKNKVLPIVPVPILPNYLVLLAHRVALNYLVGHQVLVVPLVLVALPVLAVPARLHHLVLRVVLAQAVVQAPAQAVLVHLAHQALQAHLAVQVLPLANFHRLVHLITIV